MNSTFLSKQDLTSHELQLLSSEMSHNEKSPVVAWMLWIFFGGFGGHRYYLGKIGTGIAMTFTLGGLGFWTLIDLFLLSGLIREANEKIEREAIDRILMIRQAKENDANERLLSARQAKESEAISLEKQA
jgi:TM2 domain-containing membrane protein YozV